MIHGADKIQISPVWRETQLDSDPLDESKTAESKMLFLTEFIVYGKKCTLSSRAYVSNADSLCEMNRFLSFVCLHYSDWNI